MLERRVSADYVDVNVTIDPVNAAKSAHATKLSGERNKSFAIERVFRRESQFGRFEERKVSGWREERDAISFVRIHAFRICVFNIFEQARLALAEQSAALVENRLTFTAVSSSLC